MTQRWKSPRTGQWDPSELPHLLEHPSWAPNWWNPPQQTRAATTLTFDDRGCFSELDFCCPRIPPQQDLDDTSPFLVLQGILLGILNVGDPPTYPHGTTLVHAPPHCASAFTPAFLEKPKIESAGWQTLRGVAKPEMPWFVDGVQKHLENDCTLRAIQGKEHLPWPSFFLLRLHVSSCRTPTAHNRVSPDSNLATTSFPSMTTLRRKTRLRANGPLKS